MNILSKNFSPLEYSRENEILRRIIQNGVVSGMDVSVNSSDQIVIQPGVFAINGVLIKLEVETTLPDVLNTFEHYIVVIEYDTELQTDPEFHVAGANTITDEAGPEVVVDYGVTIADVWNDEGVVTAAKRIRENDSSDDFYLMADDIEIQDIGGNNKRLVMNGAFLLGFTNKHKGSGFWFSNNFRAFGITDGTNTVSNLSFDIIDKGSLFGIYSVIEDDIATIKFASYLKGDGSPRTIDDDTEDLGGCNLLGVVHNEYVILKGVGSFPLGQKANSPLLPQYLSTLTSTSYGGSGVDVSEGVIDLDNLIVNIGKLKDATLQTAYDGFSADSDPGDGRLVEVVDDKPIVVTSNPNYPAASIRSYGTNSSAIENNIFNQNSVLDVTTSSYIDYSTLKVPTRSLSLKSVLILNSDVIENQPAQIAMDAGELTLSDNGTGLLSPSYVESNIYSGGLRGGNTNDHVNNLIGRMFVQISSGSTDDVGQEDKVYKVIKHDVDDVWVLDQSMSADFNSESTFSVVRNATLLIEDFSSNNQECYTDVLRANGVMSVGRIRGYLLESRTKPSYSPLNGLGRLPSKRPIGVNSFDEDYFVGSGLSKNTLSQEVSFTGSNHDGSNEDDFVKSRFYIELPDRVSHVTNFSVTIHINDFSGSGGASRFRFEVHKYQDGSSNLIGFTEQDIAFDSTEVISLDIGTSNIDEEEGSIVVVDIREVYPPPLGWVSLDQRVTISNMSLTFEKRGPS